MLRVRPIEARQGMTLALPVTHPRQAGTLLLRAGIRLDRKTIERLREIHVPELWIECPALRQIARSGNPYVQMARARVTRHIADVFDAAAHNAELAVDYPVFRRAISSLLDKLALGEGAPVFVAQLASAGDSVIRHATDVSYISVLIGLKLDFYLLRERPKLSPYRAKDVSSLGVGAMLHDIGMTRLSPEVVRRWEETGDETDEEWRRHAALGYEMVSGRVDPAAAAAVLHHHQRYDGAGFPTRHGLGGEDVAVNGSDIHVFARIIAAADLFDRLLHPPGGSGEVVPSVRALNQLQSAPYRQRLDPIVLRGLLSVCPPYAPGTSVTLSDGRRCVVSAWSPVDPCRPDVVEIIRDDDPSEMVLGETIELHERPDLCVAEVDAQDVTDENYTLEHMGGWGDLTDPAPSPVPAAGG